MMTIQTSILLGNHIKLEPLTETHREELYAAAQNEAIWTFTGSKAFGEEFAPWFQSAIENFQLSKQIPFVVRQLSDLKIIGSTRLYDVYPHHQRVTIGYTWFVPQVWGTYVNPESKLLLLKYVFENLQFNRVEFVADARNTRSKNAIKKLGATEEGTLRQHMVLDNGYIRDSTLFSIIKSEWPSVKEKLCSRLNNMG